MTKQELASYMVALISIMESKEDAGRPRGDTLAREYNQAYNELIQLIKEDEASETGKRTFDNQRTEGGTTQSRG